MPALGVGGGVVNTGSFSKALWPGVYQWYGDSYAQWPKLYDKMFSVEKSTKLYEELVSMGGMGLGETKQEGSPVQYASFKQGYVNRLVQTVYALGFIITKEIQDDDQYNIKLTEKGTRFLSKSMMQLKETLGANIYNNGFSAASATTHVVSNSDLTLFQSSHPTLSGKTYRNIPSSAADLSEAALEQAVIDIETQFIEESGLKMIARPETLFIPPALQFIAERTLRNPLRPGTADRDINAMYQKGLFTAEVIRNPYLTSTSAYFIKTDVENGMILLEREGFELKSDNDFDTDNAKFKVSERYVFDWVDPRGVYGVNGP